MAKTTFSGPVNSVNGFEIDGVPLAAGGVTSVNAQTGAVVLQGAAVPNAAGATPTKAEFDALLSSLRTATLLDT